MKDTAPLRLTPEQVSDYQQDGFLVLEDLIGREEIDAFLAHQETRSEELNRGRAIARRRSTVAIPGDASQCGGHGGTDSRWDALYRADDVHGEEGGRKRKGDLTASGYAPPAGGTQHAYGVLDCHERHRA